VVDVNHGVLRSYSGNYDDYLAKQRLEANAREDAKAAEGVPTPVPSSASTEPPSPSASEAAEAPKLSKAERARMRERRKERERIERRVARLEVDIHEKEAALEALNWKLGAPEIASDASQLIALQGERDETRDAIDGLYADWERLADEIAALDDAPT
jgi:ATPase subunit of ABC transporter with duplicated ATPase domains